jgi:hypothetical protein
MIAVSWESQLKTILKTASFVQNVNHPSGADSKIWQKMPITLLKLAGSVLDKHVG